MCHNSHSENTPPINTINDIGNLSTVGITASTYRIPEIILILRSTASAQCSPRPACPLKGALLMQVHDRPQSAPVLALAGDSVSLKCMQNHAPYACMAFLRKNGGIFGIF